MYCNFRRRSWHEPDLEHRGPDLERRVSEDASFGTMLTLRDEYSAPMTLHEESTSDTETTTPPALTISSPTAAENISGQ